MYKDKMRPYNPRPSYNGSNLTPTERLIGFLCYASGGIVGLIYLVFVNVTRGTVKGVIRFHGYQSIILSILYFVASIILDILISMVKIIPFFGALIQGFVWQLNGNPIVLGQYSLIHSMILILIVYLMIMAFMGRYTNLPWVTNFVRNF